MRFLQNPPRLRFETQFQTIIYANAEEEDVVKDVGKDVVKDVGKES